MRKGNETAGDRSEYTYYHPRAQWRVHSTSMLLRFEYCSKRPSCSGQSGILPWDTGSVLKRHGSCRVEGEWKPHSGEQHSAADPALQSKGEGVHGRNPRHHRHVVISWRPSGTTPRNCHISANCPRSLYGERKYRAAHPRAHAKPGQDSGHCRGGIVEKPVIRPGWASTPGAWSRPLSPRTGSRLGWSRVDGCRNS